MDDWNSPEEVRRRARFEYRCHMHNPKWNPDPSLWVRLCAPLVKFYAYPWSSLQQWLPDWIRLRFILGYRSVRLPDLGWSDVDVRMFHACFVLLGQFVEDELGREPTGKVRVRQERLWGYSGEYYRGYCVHSASGTHERAIDLWLWYSRERPEVLKERQRLSDLVYGRIDGSRKSLFGGPPEPDAIRAKRSAYRSDLREFEAKQFGVDTETGRPKHAIDLDDAKLNELIVLRRALWT